MSESVFLSEGERCIMTSQCHLSLACCQGEKEDDFNLCRIPDRCIHVDSITTTDNSIPLTFGDIFVYILICISFIFLVCMFYRYIMLKRLEK